MNRPWTTNHLRRLGKRICDSNDPSRDVGEYVDVMVWYNDLATTVQRKLSELDWSALLVERPVSISSRAKTIDTLREKLLRDSSTPLQNVQDLAGVRFEAEMTLSEQDAVASAIAGLFDHPASSIHDMREEPHSGYRGVHVWLRLPEGRVEVQVRTTLQGEWANAYESMADIVGRHIRYGSLPDDGVMAKAVVELQNISTQVIRTLEETADRRLSQELQLADLRRDGLDDTPDFMEMERRIQKIARDQKSAHDAVVEQLRYLNREVDRLRTGRGSH